ncbi:hypothetical protein ACHQM5_013110 [Ranunculus cassubicifolius]
MERFPLIYRISNAKFCTVESCFSRNQDSIDWNLKLVRRLGDAEIAQVAELLQVLDIAGGAFHNGSDSRTWMGKPRFTVRAATAVLAASREENLTVRDAYLPATQVWLSKVPLKINFFVWVLSRNRVLTHDNLEKRGFHFPSRCCFCVNHIETVDHLFVSCPMIMEIWDFIFGVFGIIKPCEMSVASILAVEGDRYFSDKGRVYWEMIKHSAFWTIWKERNLRIFEEEITEEWRLIDRIKENVWKWGLAFEETKMVSIETIMFSIGRIVRVM